MNFKNLAMWGIIVILTIGLYNMFKNPEEIILRSFTKVIQNISSKKNYPRGKKVLGLIDSLKFSNKNVKLTLSGCIIEKIQNSVIIYPEKR